MVPVTSEASPAAPVDDETRAIIEQLDADNEHFMLVTIELRDLLEEAVTREVALERRVEELVALNQELRAQLDRVEGELCAIHATKVLRLSRVPRTLYSRIRRRRA